MMRKKRNGAQIALEIIPCVEIEPNITLQQALSIVKFKKFHTGGRPNLSWRLNLQLQKGG